MANRSPLSPRTALISARKIKGLSRPQIAAKLGVSAHYVAMIENGRQSPSLPIMQNWLIMLGETSLDLFRRDQPSPEKAAKSIKSIKAARIAKRRAFKTMKTAAA